MSLPIYQMVSDETVLGMFKISLVGEPASESDFIKLKKNGSTFFTKLSYDEDKKIIVGALLIPNKRIFRFNEKLGAHYIVFTPEEIERLSISMFENFKNNNPFNLNHASELPEKSVSILSLWQKESNNDLSLDYNLDVPVGTLLIKARVNDESLWKQIKDGEINGFSPEIQSFKVKLQKQNEMNKDKTGRFYFNKTEVGSPIFEKDGDKTFLTSEKEITLDEVKLTIEDGMVTEVTELSGNNGSNQNTANVFEQFSTTMLSGVKELLSTELEGFSTKLSELESQISELKGEKKIEEPKERDLTILSQYKEFEEKFSVKKVKKD